MKHSAWYDSQICLILVIVYSKTGKISLSVSISVISSRLYPLLSNLSITAKDKIPFPAPGSNTLINWFFGYLFSTAAILIETSAGVKNCPFFFRISFCVVSLYLFVYISIVRNIVNKLLYIIAIKESHCHNIWKCDCFYWLF